MVIVTEEICVGCGRCVPFCPAEALKTWGYLEIDSSKCIDCGVCVENCPVGALNVIELPV